MTHRPTFRAGCCLAVLLLATSNVAKAQSVSAVDLLNGSRCDHVIDMILRYGVNNSFDCAAGSLVSHSPFGPLLFPGDELGDLEIVDVTRVEHEDPACGPTISVSICNNSTRDVKDFRVTAVAVLGRIRIDSPCQTVRVHCIEAGATTQVDLALPVDAFSMGNRAGQPIGYDKLVVAIDSFDQWMETNEANNIRAFRRDDVPLVLPATASVEAVNVDPTATSTVRPTNTAPAAPAAPAGVESTVPQAPNRSQSVDFGGTDAEPVERDSLQSAIDRLGTPADQNGSDVVPRP